MISESSGVLLPVAPKREVAGTQVTSPAGVIDLWRAAGRTLAARSAPILLCAVLGLASAPILGASLNAALTFEVYFRTNGIYPSYSTNFYAQLMLQAALGTFAISLARGAITWIALTHARGNPAPLREALRRSASRLPLLLLSAMLYGVLVTLGIAGLTLLLRQLRVDITSVGRVVNDFEGMLRAVLVRVINGYLPDPGAPFTELVSYARFVMRRASSSYYWLFAYRYTQVDIPLQIWLISAASAVPFISAGLLLRLRVPTIMDAAQPNQLADLYAGIRLSVHKAGYLLGHGAALWLITSTLNVLFVIIPLAVSQYALVPAAASQTQTLFPYPASTLLFAVGTALIGATVIAFIAVYEAHLYRQVKG